MYVDIIILCAYYIVALACRFISRVARGEGRDNNLVLRELLYCRPNDGLKRAH